MTTARPLDQISTCWPLIADPVQFTLRYAPAIERYLQTLLRDGHDAEEVLQEFLLRGLEQGFFRGAELRGRFRDYLKRAVRNAAVDHLRRRRVPIEGRVDLTEVPMPGSEQADREWVVEWRECVLARAWEGLYAHQRRSPGNLFHTVLQATMRDPEANSTTLALQVSEATGQPLTAHAFRKQLSRARRLFAELILEEVRHTLPEPTREGIEDELAALSLLTYLRNLLPDTFSAGPPTNLP